MVVFVLVAFLLASCSGFVRTMPSFPRVLEQQDQDSAAELSGAVDRFYRAHNIKEATKALDDATSVAPDAAVTHEIAGHLAKLRGDEDAAWRHYYLALATPRNQAAKLHLNDLLGVSMTASQYRETLALFDDLFVAHPDEELKQIAAAFVASWRRRLEGDAPGAEEALSKRGPPVDFAIISAFDNEDGQGFSVEYPPEREIDYSKEYTGTQLPALWRKKVPQDHQHNISFSDLVSPGADVVAYALTYLSVPSKGEYMIRVTSSNAVKMWVNDIPMLTEQKVEEDAVDQFRVPVVLRAGWNKILVKSCHERGSWLLGLTVTDRAGALVPGLESSIGPENVSLGAPPGEKYLFERDLEEQLRAVEEPFRKKYYAIQLADRTGLLDQALDLSERYRHAVPKGLLSRLEFALTTWSSGQLGATIDILDALLDENGAEAAWLFVLRADYFDEQERSARAREDLLAAVEAQPEFRTARNRLADNYANEGWTENHLSAREADAERWPDDTETLWGLADVYQKLGRRPEAEEIYEKILDSWKGASDILRKMTNLALLRSDYPAAIERQEALIELFPNTPGYYLNLGDIYRRAGRYDAAVRTYERCLELDDRWSTPVKRLGALAYERGEPQRAVELWRKSLELDPDNHSLADRLEFIDPQEDSLFESFIPDGNKIRKVLDTRASVEPHPGSDLIFLLDHAVGQVSMDGSSRQVVTQVLTAVNDTGRDKLTRQSLPPGRIRIIEAYAIDPDGARYEASSVRHGTVRFRELKVGSAVVIQYRHDEYPGGYLSRHLSRRWFFHGPGSQFEDSHYVLIVPEEMKTVESGHGDWKRNEKRHGGRRVLEYRATNVAPLVAEPFAPPAVDLLDQVAVSSISDWDTIAGWDAALLVNAFRTTPKLKELAQTLVRDAETKQDKLDALTRFVMREIRYQQDYENTIAGVKPHAAPIVLQRAYGDCKDKSVLLMTLAKEVGIETRFALLRTTGVGRFIKELPSLQFNHAIVYVPKQEGIDEPLFVDATPDTLDLKTLRPDSQNTWAMVIDPQTEKWEFVRIPLATADKQYTLRSIRIDPKVEGESAAKLELTFQGPAAAAVRSVLRNMDDTRVFAAQLATSMFPGALVDDVSFSGEDDIIRPATLKVSLKSSSIVRRQGDDVVIELPRSENLSKFTGLAERRLPLQTSLFLSLVETTEEVALPEGYAVRHVPEDMSVDNQFFAFERKVEQAERKVSLKLRFKEKMQRISPENYPEFRAAVTEIIENLGQDLVLKPVDEKKRKKKKSRKK